MTMVGDFEVCQLQFATHFVRPVFCWNKTPVNDEGSYRKVQKRATCPTSPATKPRELSCPVQLWKQTSVSLHATQLCAPALSKSRLYAAGTSAVASSLFDGRASARPATYPSTNRPMPLARPTEALYFTGDNGGSVS